jgi:glucose/mannose-6-phosphate isomerase
VAKRLATLLLNKLIILVASEHLVGAAHAFKNQLNENSKTFSALFDLPELNHHLLEALANPKGAKPFLQFLFLNSSLYSPDIGKRYPVAMEVVEKNNVAANSFECFSQSKLEQIFELLTLGEYVSFYLAMLYGLDPTPIVWVDYFKKKLG